MILLRTILGLILFVALATLFACGGGEEGETSSQATSKSKSSSEYPSNPEDVVRAFFDESKKGNVKDAVAKYVQNSEEFYAQLVEDRNVEEFENAMQVMNVTIAEVEQTSENSAMAKIHYTHPEKSGSHLIQVIKENGKWKMEEKFWQ